MNDSSLLGNLPAQNRLRYFLSKQESFPVLLFSGPPGVGKKTFALAFAEALLGKKHGPKIRSGNHPDVIRIVPEGKLGLHTRAAIDKILEEAFLLPFEAEKKIYLIEEAERMAPVCANALLKLLEEPPSHVVFLLITDKEEEILPTLLSRCAPVSFSAVDEENLTTFALQRGIDPQKARLLALEAKGSFAELISLSEKGEDPVETAFLALVSRCLFRPLGSETLELLEKIEKILEGKEEGTLRAAEKGIDIVLFWIRDLHYLRVEPEGKDLTYPGYREILSLFREVPVPSFETAERLSLEARLALQRGVRPRAVFETLLFRLRTQAW